MRGLARSAALCLTSAALAAGFTLWWRPAPEFDAPAYRAALTAYDAAAGPIVPPEGRPFDPALLYPNFVNAAARVKPTVVNIKALSGGGLSGLWSRERPIGTSSGSGVIISADGYILTNNHVVDDGADIEVTLDDRREYEAEVVGRDPATDLALLKIDAAGLAFAEFGDSDSLHVGEWVLAVGNPFDLRSTVTAGIVSAKTRAIDILEGSYSIESFIQTDAAVNPGNSGGALVNTRGQLVGINTAIITRSGRYEGYSFAVPSSLARKVVEDLLEFGTVQHGLLGVELAEVTSARAEELGLARAEGVYIHKVTPHSAAADAGLRPGDVVVAVGGLPTGSVPALKESVGRYRPGATVALRYIREGRVTTVDVMLKDVHNAVAVLPSRGRELMQEFGFELRDLTDGELETLPAPGVKVVSIYLGSRIDRTRMDPEYIITRVNHQPVRSVGDFAEVIDDTGDEDDVLLEGYYANYNGEYYYAFKR